MFLSRCRLLIKRIYNSFAMFNKDNIAVAQLAQIFGSELLKVQENATTDGGSRPQIVNINPKQFLVQDSPSFASRNKEQEQFLMRQLQAEAEAAYPINTPSAPPPTGGGPGSPEVQMVRPSIPVRLETPAPAITSDRQMDILLVNVERIAVSLEKIVECIGKPSRIKSPKANKKKPVRKSPIQ